MNKLAALNRLCGYLKEHMEKRGGNDEKDKERIAGKEMVSGFD